MLDYRTLLEQRQTISNEIAARLDLGVLITLVRVVYCFSKMV